MSKRVFKAVLFLLLAVNTAYFVIYQTTAKGIDSAAWFTLLVLFEAETGFGQRLAIGRVKPVVRGLRLLAALGVFAATIGYVFEDNVLDAANSVLWIGVVVLLELEVRAPDLAARRRGAFSMAAAVLYGSLGMLVAVWAMHAMWIDAYDAALWLTAFATLELDILRRGSEAA